MACRFWCRSLAARVWTIPLRRFPISDRWAAPARMRTNRRLDWSVSPQDVSKNLVTSFAYDLPFGKGKRLFNSAPRIANLLISGWQANGILSFATGTPVIIGGASNNTQGAIFTPSGQRPNNNGTSAKTSNQNINTWFNTSVFSNPAPFTFGTSPRTLPDVRNPGVCNTDLSFFKNNFFGHESRYNVQFRAEAFNALNHAQFGSPDANINDGNFGKITGMAHTPRELQLALKFIF